MHHARLERSRRSNGVTDAAGLGARLGRGQHAPGHALRGVRGLGRRRGLARQLQLGLQGVQLALELLAPLLPHALLVLVVSPGVLHPTAIILLLLQPLGNRCLPLGWRDILRPGQRSVDARLLETGDHLADLLDTATDLWTP